VFVDKKIVSIVNAGREGRPKGRHSGKRGKLTNKKFEKGGMSGDGDKLDASEVVGSLTEEFACDCGKTFPRNNSLVRHKRFFCLLNSNPNSETSSKRTQTPSPLKTPKSSGLKLLRPSPITPAKASLDMTKCSDTDSGRRDPAIFVQDQMLETILLKRMISPSLKSKDKQLKSIFFVRCSIAI
jgi:hypothetical protein